VSTGIAVRHGHGSADSSGANHLVLPPEFLHGKLAPRQLAIQ